MIRILRRRPGMSGTAFLWASALILASGLLLQWTASAQDSPQKHLSHGELKALVRNATTRKDHLRIAAYYHAEAVRLQKQASEHADLASAYANGTQYSPKGIPGGEFEHCKCFAESIGRAAKDAEALAVAHQEMANQIKQ